MLAANGALRELHTFGSYPDVDDLRYVANGIGCREAAALVESAPQLQELVVADFRAESLKEANIALHRGRRLWSLHIRQLNIDLTDETDLDLADMSQRARIKLYVGGTDNNYATISRIAGYRQTWRWLKGTCTTQD